VVGKDQSLSTAIALKSPAELQEEREKLPASKSWSGFLGVNWSGNLQETYPKPEAQLKLVGESGAKMFRVVIGEKVPGDHSADQVFIEAAKEGVTILPNIVGLPTREDKLIVPLKPGSTVREEWVRELHNLVSRYGPGGKFWTDHPALNASLAPEYWEIWNEPNYATQGAAVGGKKGVTDPELFGELLEVSKEAITSVDKNAKIVLGGLLTVGKFEHKKEEINHVTVGEFIREVDKSGHSDDYDVLSLHPYAFEELKANASPAQIESLIANVRSKVRNNIKVARGALDSAKLENRRIWITELGWPVRNPGYATEDGSHHLVTEEVQQALLNATFNMVKEFSGTNEGSYKIGKLLWYNIQDNYQQGNKEVDPKAWDAHCGLVQDQVKGIPGEEGKMRPAWTAFQEQAE